MPVNPPDFNDFTQVVAALMRGDFTALNPLFDQPPSAKSSVLSRWVDDERFADERAALNEAVTCACFNGRTQWVAHLLAHGADFVAGNGTGSNGLHWAANRGHIDVVRLLLARRPDVELRNSYGGTVLGATVWAAVHEPRPGQREIVAELLRFGADPFAAELPSGDAEIDAALHHARATR